ncbi:hypothetical protein ACFCZ3_11900 [Cellulosimicrobium cellulans]|uniref:DUF6414 family protein n=1 Tax=Cellulosimicrobium cellulans TaxID=1710 RepID=UPI0035E3505B
MASKSKQSKAKPEKANLEMSSPAVAIYQNAEQVAGILQQFFGQPLVTGESRDSSDEQTDSSRKEGGATGEGAAEAGVPFFGRAKFALKANLSLENSEIIAAGTRTTQNFVYSQAYYLHIVRSALHEAGLVKGVSGAVGARDLAPGDFVEYRAQFAPSEFIALMDVITPEAVGKFVQARIVSSQSKKIAKISNANARQAAMDALQLDASAKCDMAIAATEAVKADFRAESTREYYGAIVGGELVTAVTICDVEHFVVADEDRILDGQFTVLGKVASAVEDDAPVLRRNKVLKRLLPDVVDEMFDTLRQSAKKKNVPGGKSPADFVDLSLQSRVEGPSFRVVPVAIFV